MPREEVRMRGTFVPFYGLNNMFGQIPMFGLFLGGGSKEGLVGLTYEVVGHARPPMLRVNPISVVAPGLLRKFFEFPNAGDRTQVPYDPPRYGHTPSEVCRDRSPFGIMPSHRLQQHVALAAERQLDHAFRRQVLTASASSSRRSPSRR